MQIYKQQECIPVGCILPGTVAVSPATHAPLPYTSPATHVPLPHMAPAMQTPHHACPLQYTPPAMHAPCHAHLPFANFVYRW